ncbi:helix-turn-helix domain-containing protein [Nocardioides sp. REDSEA-S30_B4]|uniref:helix-turn-helix domain-containing protein n=1 Tax=Nocardioides sp. REDSEA-S30_B4 TaxID=1811552 RepID=UPI0025F034E1|nr:helix-turn-helix domain-containing protein [Nocardioides sp. REDSEA-S30_B4]
MTTYRIAEAAELLGVSDDTLRRWVDAGRLRAEQEEGRTVVPGAALAAFAADLAGTPDPGRSAAVSARNRLVGAGWWRWRSSERWPSAGARPGPGATRRRSPCWRRRR